MLLTNLPHKIYNQYFVYFNLYILDNEWQTECSGPSGIRHSLSWLCSKFLHECSFYSLPLFPNTWMLQLIICIFIVILYCILATRHKHALSLLSITSRTLFLLATHKMSVFLFLFHVLCLLYAINEYHQHKTEADAQFQILLLSLNLPNGVFWWKVDKQWR